MTRTAQSRKGEQMLTLEEWLKERYDNCVSIANMKSGVERMGWLEDATYFEAALSRLKEAGQE